MVTTITKPILRPLADEMQAALQAIAAKHGLTVKIGNCSFDQLHATYKLHVQVQETATGMSGAEAEFRRYAPMFGLKPDTYGKTFQSNGRPYTISGINLKGRHRTVLATRDDGKQFVFPVDIVCLRLGVTNSHEAVD